MKRRLVSTLAIAAFGFVLVLAGAGTVAAEVGIEYIAHACFVIESPEGTRIVIDPYNAQRWLGYGFPQEVEANAVLVTHPHYDHDASYYWGDAVPVFREAGSFSMGDVRLQGIVGRHAGPYGKDFEQKNTIWIVETGGLRIAHLGDNGPLTEENLKEMGRIDVLMLPVDGLDHILKTVEVAAIRDALNPAVTIPMHYRLEGFLGLPRSLGPLGPWEEKQSGVERLPSNRTRLTAGKLGSSRILVFEPTPSLRVWPKGLAEGWQKLDEARKLMGENGEAAAQAARLVGEAAELGDSIVFAVQWARALKQTERADEAIAFLEAALARAGQDDWEYRMRAHALLGELYRDKGWTERAAGQYRIVLDNSYRTELREQAQAFFAATVAK